MFYTTSEAERYGRAVKSPVTKYVHTPSESGKALARLVLDPALEGAGGRYFEGEHEIRSSLESYDESIAADLWEGSAELVERYLSPALEKSVNAQKG